MSLNIINKDLSSFCYEASKEFSGTVTSISLILSVSGKYLKYRYFFRFYHRYFIFIIGSPIYSSNSNKGDFTLIIWIGDSGKENDKQMFILGTYLCLENNYFIRQVCVMYASVL